MELNKIYNEDCLIGMNRIPDKSMDMILCDLPYGTTACKWDVVIPFKSLWEHYERVIKDNGAIVLTGSQPFTSALIMSNPRLFKYEWIWDKRQCTGFMTASKMPMKRHENVLIFYKKQPTYHPQMIERSEAELKRIKHTGKRYNLTKESFIGHGTSIDKGRTAYSWKHPSSIIEFKARENKLSDQGLHPTQKPVSLFSHLIRTYTNPGDIVLDNCIGSGTTAISCIQEGRNYIGFERSPMAPHDQYYKVCMNRIEKELARPKQLKLIV